VARTQPPASVPGAAGGTVYGTQRGTGTPLRAPGGPRKPKPRWGRIALVIGGLVALIALLAGGCGIAYVSNLDEKLHRTDAFSGLDDRPGKSVDGTQNILLLGSDSRDGADYDPNGAPKTGGAGKNERSDALMVLHIPKDHSKAYLISIPRDTYVYVPELDGHGGTRAKINAAFSWGGIPLTVKTVENFTGVKIDHVVKIDFNGFKAMTDAVGGVDVTVDETVTDPRSKRTFKAGVNHLDGNAALDYVRQRYGLANGDFDRVKRQQIFMRALMQKATDSGTLTNPMKLKNFLDAATTSLTVDNAFSLKDMALEFRGLRPADISFITSPHLGSQNVDGQSVVVSDKEKAIALWGAVEKDKVADWLVANPANNATRGS